MMESAALGWVSQILQHKVIAMASCCKRAMVRKGTTATAKHALERPGEEHQVTRASDPRYLEMAEQNAKK
ncbi:hypothetical protein GR306_03935 [Klebsiella pneumoniae]|nr:hypothetical protein GR306_03935 [Klebsiella pneumoniae]